VGQEPVAVRATRVDPALSPISLANVLVTLSPVTLSPSHAALYIGLGMTTTFDAHIARRERYWWISDAQADAQADTACAERSTVCA
jgi:hypothetical protein